MGDFAKNLTIRISGLEAELVRVQEKAAQDLVELKGHIAVLKQCQAALTPENEALLVKIKMMGLL